MAVKAKLLKDKIKETLDGLVRTETLGEVFMENISEGFFNRDLSRFPVAILPPPYITSDIYTNAENMRTYNFEIAVIVKEENQTGDGYVEELMETLIATFDNLPSLEGVAEGGLEPATSPTEVITIRGKSYTVFRVILKARALASITL